MLLQVVTDARDVGGYLVAVGQTHTGDLTKRGVRLLGGRGTHGSADASLLRSAQIGLAVLQGVETLLHGGRRRLVGSLFSALSHQLVKSRHGFPPFLEK